MFVMEQKKDLYNSFGQRQNYDRHDWKTGVNLCSFQNEANKLIFNDLFSIMKHIKNKKFLSVYLEYNYTKECFVL